MAKLRLLEEYLNREFGELDLDLQDPGARATDIAASVPQVRANEVLNQGEQQQFGIEPPSFGDVAAPEGDLDRTRMLGAGVVTTGEMALGIPEYIARQNKYLRPTVAPAIESLRGGLAETREGILEGVSPDYLEQVGREVMTLDPNKTIWQGNPLEVADSIYGKFLQSLPSTLLVMLPAARLFRAGNTAGAYTYLGASEGGLSVGAIQNNLTDEIASMSNDELLQESRRYAEIYDSVGGDEELARQEFTAEAQGAAPLLGGIGVASISLATGRLLKPVFSEGGLGLGRRVAQGFVAEAPQEASQGATEQFVQNYAARIYDEQRALGEGVLEAAGQEGLIGGLTGGAVGGAFGARPPRPEPPLPAPEEGPGGQMGLPGIGIAQPQAPAPEAPPEAPEGAYVPNTGMGLQTEIWPDPGTTEAVMVPQEQAPGQDTLPLGIAGTVPLRERGPGHRTLQDGDIPVVPDAADQPTAEPQADIQAQIEDMRGPSGRSAVYLSPQQARMERIQLPKGAVVIPNFDGKGGRLIAKNAAAARHARERRAEGGSMQAIIGELTLAGAGKPNVRSGYAVQLLGEGDTVARESLVATKKEANDLQKKWGADGEVRVLSGEQALQRRGDLIEREQIDLRTEDPALVSEATGDLFDAAEAPDVLTGRDTQTTTEGQLVTLLDEDGNVIVEEEFATPEEAEARTDELAKDFPDAFVKSQPKRVRTTADKVGVSAVREAPKRELKGPPEGPPPRPSSEREAVEDVPSKKAVVEPSQVGEFDPDISIKDIENLPSFDVEYSVVDEVPQANKSVKLTERRETKSFTSRTAARAFATRMSNAVKKKYPDGGFKDAKVTAQDSPELEGQFQSAVQARADRKQTLTFPRDREEGKPPSADEASDNRQELISEYRTKNRTPSEKIQFIRRERASQLRRREPIKNVRATPVTRVERGGKTRETKTEPLTYKTVSGEETAAQERKRISDVKQANARLKTALTGAKNFVNRFNNQGEYGTYVADNTNLDGSFNDKARDFAKARDALFQLIEFAEATLASDNQSNAHATMARQIAASLERVKLKSITPQKFADEFKQVFESTEYKMLKTVPQRFRESANERTRKVLKLNAERARANERKALIEEKWKGDKIWNEIVGPIFRKFSDATLLNASAPERNAYYKPTEFEIENLRYAMRTYRKMGAKYPANEFYGPIKEQLEYYGFEFDEKGDLIAQPFSPSENLLSSGFIAKHGVSKKEAADSKREAVETEQTVGKRVTTPEIREAQEVAENRKAVRDIRTANALLRRFKERTSTAKTTISGIKRQEQRFIRGLRKIGAWVEVSPTMGRISIGGFKSKTYRLVGPRLDNRTMLKSDAKGFIQRIAELPMPRELVTIANRMGGVEASVQDFVDQNSVDLFFEKTQPEKYDTNYLGAARAIGDFLEARGSLSATDALTEILKEAPVDSFYYQLADKLSALNLTDVEVAYGSESDFRGGQLGKFRPSENLVLLNREALQELQQQGDRVFGARVMHVLTHEIMHSATHVAIRNDTGLRRYFEALQQRTREHVIANNIPRTQYGLKKGAPIDEFVVEAFSNYEFQNLLKEVPATPTNVWEKIIEFIRKYLGLTEQADTVFDAVMVTEDILFEEAGASGPRGAGDFFLEDTWLNNTANTVRNRITGTNSIFQRVREQARTGFKFNAAAFNILTMEQFREAYDKYFNGMLGKYVEAFNRRNASAAQRMQLPEKLARRWTALQEKDAIDGTSHALNLSRVMTEATLNRETATEGSGDIQTQFHQLSDEAQKLYREVRDYYKQAVKEEQKFLMQSALRGITGINVSDQRLSQIETKDDLRSLLEEHIVESEVNDVLDMLWQMSQVAQQFEGDYFPLMRYGEEVVYAEKQLPSEFFEDRKEAWARRKEIADTDPTLDVQMKQTEDGKWEVRTFEREFVMAETRSEIEQEWERLKQEYGETNVFDPQKRRSKQMDAAIRSNAQLNSILKTLEGNAAAQAAIKNFYLRSLSESSMRKHEIRRKNRRGVRYDMQHRNLATYAKQSSYYTSQLEHGWKMADAVKEMEEFLGRRQAGSGEATTRNLSLVLEHLKKRDQMGTDLPDVNDLVRKGVEGTHFFMLTSPSYWAINATQPWMISLPTMASKFGYGQTMSAMRDIQRLIAPKLVGQAAKTKGGIAALRDRVLTEDTFNVLEQVEDHIKENAPERYQQYKSLLDDLRDRHIIDINVFTEMRELAAGKDRSTWTNLVDASRIMAHLTEVNNRVLTALSAYQLALNSGMDDAAARTYAGDMVSQTQFNYSSQNKPPLFQAGGPIGGVAPLMFQFMQWPQHMYAHLIRNFAKLAADDVITRQEARRAVIGLLGTHAAVGGLTGMMLQPIKWAFGFAMLALGDEDEPYTLATALSGATFDRFLADVTADAFGTQASTILMKGLPAGVGIDLSARMSMGTFYYVDLRGDNAQSVLGSLVASFGGATLNQAIKMGRGVGQVLDGDMLKGVETASPKMARDVLRAVRYYNEGLVNNAGDTVIDASDMSPAEVLVQFFGFQPTDVSNFYERQNAIKSAERYATGRRAELLQRFRQAETQAERREVRRDIRDFNRANPAERIEGSTLLENIKSQRTREARFRRYGVNIDERKARFYERFGEAYE